VTELFGSRVISTSCVPSSMKTVCEPDSARMVTGSRPSGMTTGDVCFLPAGAKNEPFGVCNDIFQGEYTGRMLFKKKEKEEEKPPILLLDATPMGDEMQGRVQEHFSDPDHNINVLLVKTYEELEDCFWVEKREPWDCRKFWQILPKMQTIPQDFSMGIFNVDSDLRVMCQPRNIMEHAILLSEHAPVLLYSPRYTGISVKKLQETVEKTSIAVFSPAAIPDATALHLYDKEVAVEMVSFLQKVRRIIDFDIQNVEFQSAIQAFHNFFNKSAEIRTLCMRILDHEEKRVRLAFA